MICTKCGANIHDNAKFCNVCGQALEQAQSFSPVSQNTLPQNTVFQGFNPQGQIPQGFSPQAQTSQGQIPQAPLPQAQAPQGHAAAPYFSQPQDFVQEAQPKKSSTLKIVIIAIVSVLVIAGLVVGGIFLFGDKNNEEPTETPTVEIKPEPTLPKPDPIEVDPYEEVAGLYIFDSMEYAGTTITAETLDNLSEFSELGVTKDNLYLELTAAGKFTISAIDETANGTYKVSGTKLTLTSGGTDLVTTIKDDKVTIKYEEDDLVVVFKKAPKGTTISPSAGDKDNTTDDTKDDPAVDPQQYEACAGKYNLVYIVTGSVIVSADDIVQGVMGDHTLEDFSLELTNDGKFTLITMGIKITGTYTVLGSQLNLTLPNQNAFNGLTGEIVDGKVTIIQLSSTYTFEK